ncbi:MAG: hypothetical protein JW715_00500 [Sedimentisphaerales bacterium]|nr:hypothetical protein [Sedimentisphaerales bacterium]
MQYNLVKLSGKDSGAKLQAAVFFILYFFYLWIFVQPNLLYHGGGELTNFPVFYKGWTFFNEIVRHPGGAVEYVGAFLSQLFYLNWAGAVVLTLHALLLYVFAAGFLKLIGMGRFRILGFVQAILLLITYSGYTYHFTSALVVLVGLVFSCLYLRIAGSNKYLNMLLFSVLCVVLYLMAGGAYLYFTILVGLYELLLRRKWLNGFFYFLFSIASVYVIGVLVFNNSLFNAYSDLSPFSRMMTDFSDRMIMIEFIYAIYLLFPVMIVLFGLWNLFVQSKTVANRRKKTARARKRKKGKTVVKSVKGAVIPAAFNWKSLLRQFILPIILLAMVFCFHEGQRKAAFEVDYYYCNGQWDKVIEAGGNYLENGHISHAFDCALYHLDRLSSDMFHYRQNKRFLFLSTSREMYNPWHKINIFYDLGAVNHCESCLVESMGIYGKRPYIIRKLALLRLAKGDIDTAKVYLNALYETPFHSEWAKSYLDKISSDPNLSNDSEIQRLRLYMTQGDNAFTSIPVEAILRDLLEHNPKNKMAYEFLMAWYMLLKQLDKFIAMLGLMNNLDYSDFPDSYEQAILTYMYVNKKNVTVTGYTLSEQSKTLFKQFISASDKYGTNKEAALGELADKFGDTYFFYYVYEMSGLKK